MKIIKLFIFSIFVIISVFLFFVKNVSAQTCAVSGTDGYFCSHNGNTVWGFTATYTYWFGGTPTQFYLSGLTDSPGTPSICGGANYDYYPMTISKPTSADTIEWQTACVDPVSNINVTYSCLTGPMRIESAASYEVDITCPSSNYIYSNRYGKNEPASCTGANNSGKTIPAGGWCPFGPYCMKGGNIGYDTIGSGNPGWCTGAFVQNQVVGTIPSSCTNVATCQYVSCNDNGIFSCAGTKTDTTGAYCGSSCNSACNSDSDCLGQYKCGTTVATACNQYNLACNLSTHKCTNLGASHKTNDIVCSGNLGQTCPTVVSCPIAGQKDPHWGCSNNTCTSISGCAADSCAGASDSTTCGGTCHAGTGSTIASCGNTHAYYQIDPVTGSCCDYGYSCQGNSCGIACLNSNNIPPANCPAASCTYSYCGNGSCNTVTQAGGCPVSNCSACQVPACFN